LQHASRGPALLHEASQRRLEASTSRTTLDHSILAAAASQDALAAARHATKAARRALIDSIVADPCIACKGCAHATPAGTTCHVDATHATERLCTTHGADHTWCGAAAATPGYATSSIVQPPIPIQCGICRGCLHGSTCHDASSPSWAPHSTQKLCETHGPDHRWCGPITDECGACAGCLHATSTAAVCHVDEAHASPELCLTHGDDHHWCAPPLSREAYSSKHVKCVGDSLTSGGHGGEIRSGDAGYSDVYSREKANYCAHLGVSLGAGYDVSNLGLSGATVESYASSEEYASLLSEACDVAVVTLGTNDAKVESWSPSTYYKSYKKLLKAIARHCTHVFVGVAPPTLCGSIDCPFGDECCPAAWGADPSILNVELPQLQRQVASDLDIGRHPAAHH